MIVKELYGTTSTGKKLYRTYSNENKYILQQPTNIKYEEAIDVENAPYTYIETQEVIEDEQTD